MASFHRRLVKRQKLRECFVKVQGG